jgi:hypothetical protein
VNHADVLGTATEEPTGKVICLVSTTVQEDVQGAGKRTAHRAGIGNTALDDRNGQGGEAEMKQLKRFLKVNIWWSITGFPHAVAEFYRRGRRGYGNSDAAQFSYFITMRMPDILRYIKKHSFAYPGCDEAETEEGWDCVLDQMIEGWEAAKRIHNDEYYLDAETPVFTPPENRHPTEEELKRWRDAEVADRSKFEAMMPLFVKFWFGLDIG